MLETRVEAIAALAAAQTLVEERRAALEATTAALTAALGEAEHAYTERYTGARSSYGWSVAQLRELGFPDDRSRGGTRSARRPRAVLEGAEPGPAVEDDHTERGGGSPSGDDMRGDDHLAARVV